VNYEKSDVIRLNINELELLIEQSYVLELKYNNDNLLSFTIPPRGRECVTMTSFPSSMVSFVLLGSQMIGV